MAPHSKGKRPDDRGSRNVAAAAGACGSIACYAWQRDGEPALRALLQEERERLVRQIEMASTRKHLHAGLHTLKQSLYRYQHDGVERFLARGRLLLADDMGLGKTAQPIAACHVLWHTGRVRRGLIIVPGALKLQWAS